MFFIINVMQHHYQFRWRPKRPPSCYECDKLYLKCKRDMLQYLTTFLVTNDIFIAVEEGGTCLNMQETLRSHGARKTILQEAIERVLGKRILHQFVDITSEQVSELINKKVLSHCNELRTVKAELRDKYIGEAALAVFQTRPEGNGLLLCANRHFEGVKQHFAQAAVPVRAESIDKFDWYMDSDKIGDVLHAAHIEAMK